MNINDNKFDVIIIGSGVGGLTTASLLAQLENKRVLILERHFKIGGFTHTFNRKGAMMSGVLATAVARRRPWQVMNIMSEAIRYSHQLYSKPSNVTQATI